MRESTGNALLMTLMTSVVAVVLSFLVGSISYSKSYRVKNHIIDEIEDRKDWTPDLQQEIDSYLKDVGYKVSNRKICDSDIPSNKKSCSLIKSNENGYNYCVYKCTENSSYTFFTVVTYMELDFPIINQFVNFEIKGETKSFYE